MLQCQQAAILYTLLQLPWAGRYETVFRNARSRRLGELMLIVVVVIVFRIFKEIISYVNRDKFLCQHFFIYIYLSIDKLVVYWQD